MSHDIEFDGISGNVFDMTKTSDQRRSTSRRPRSASSSKSALSSRTQGKGSLSTGQTILIGILLPFLVLTLAMPLRTFAQQRADLAETRENIAMMEQRVADLEAQKEKYSDPAYIEEQARIRLGLIKPGETPYRLMDPALGEQLVTNPENEKHQPEGTWHSMLWQSISVMPKVTEEKPNPGRDQATNPSSLPTVPE